MTASSGREPSLECSVDGFTQHAYRLSQQEANCTIIVLML